VTVYLDCNATTPVEPAVAEELMRFTVEEYGNAGSRTHEFGARVKKRVSEARAQVAEVVAATPDEVIFTSGATEANNIAILGLRAHGEVSGHRHIVASAIEHKAVLEPLEHLAANGFEVDLIDCDASGTIDPQAIAQKVRPDTLLVSLMHVNNETGAIQNISDVGELLPADGPLFHVDAAQGFGKVRGPESSRIDLISISGHKLYAPKGIGALIARKRNGKRLPLRPLMFGGGQERGLRPGTLPVGLVAALGLSCELAVRNRDERDKAVKKLRQGAEGFAKSLGAAVNSEPSSTIATTINVSVPGLNSEAAIVALKKIAAVSNGSACTSQSYEPSHVLSAMNLAPERVAQAIRISWSHLTPEVPWRDMAAALAPFRSGLKSTTGSS
jgi:cysteine desulfurase